MPVHNQHKRRSAMTATALRLQSLELSSRAFAVLVARMPSVREVNATAVNLFIFSVLR